MKRLLQTTPIVFASLTTLVSVGCGGNPHAVAPEPVAITVPPTPSQYGAPLPASPLVAAGPGTATSPTAPTRTPNAGLKVSNLSLSGDPARIVEPAGGLEAGKRYPVLIFFHGSGMDQTQLTDRTGLADKASAAGWLAASAMFTGRTHWADDAALRATGNLVQTLVDKYQADPQRLYFVGFSMGGGTALLAATNPLNLPYRAAAVVSTQGFTDLEAMTKAEAGGGAYARAIADAYGGSLTPEEATAHSPVDHAAKLQGIPVYLEHGEADQSVPPSHTERMAQALEALGMAPEVHYYPGKGHSEDTIGEDAIIHFLTGKAAP